MIHFSDEARKEALELKSRLQCFDQYEAIPYSKGLVCTECERSGIVSDLPKPKLVGYTVTPIGIMVVFECPFCFQKFRFHSNFDNLFDEEEFLYQLYWHWYEYMDEN